MLALKKGKPRKKIIQGNTWQVNSRVAMELGCVVATCAIHSSNATLGKFQSFKVSVYAEPWKL